MAHYRIFFLEGNKVASTATIIECDTDECAIARATSIRSLQPIELWQGDRLVKRIDPATP
jgi:hypothetical protein